jgi:hypothetical protein
MPRRPVEIERFEFSNRRYQAEISDRLDVASGNQKHRILLLDTSTPSHGIEDITNSTSPHLDLVVFDTTCFSSGSGRIRRVLSWARRCRLPIILVRSHTKLDSLGIEYGRLGSAVFVNAKEAIESKERELQRILANEMRQAVRLFGDAALPAHFPPFAGNDDYRQLTDRRVAAILRNSRRAARYLSQAVPGSSGQLNHAHGLYLTLAPKCPVDEGGARELADHLSNDLSEIGLPVRHAGSFGFDFVATEWFLDSESGRYMIRIAVPDLPTLLWDQILKAIARWTYSHGL